MILCYVFNAVTLLALIVLYDLIFPVAILLPYNFKSHNCQSNSQLTVSFTMLSSQFSVKTNCITVAVYETCAISTCVHCSLEIND